MMKLDMLCCIVLIGMGIMGGLMVVWFVFVGFLVVVWNRIIEKVLVLEGVGVVVVLSVVDVVIDVDIVICMLSFGLVCEEVLMVFGGVLDGMKVGVMFVVMSFIFVEMVVVIVSVVVVKDIVCVDVLVFGGEKGVKDGMFVIMVGGEVEVIVVFMDVFVLFGCVMYVGFFGSGVLIKFVNQLIVVMMICVVVEVFMLV